MFIYLDAKQQRLVWNNRSTNIPLQLKTEQQGTLYTEPVFSANSFSILLEQDRLHTRIEAANTKTPSSFTSTIYPFRYDWFTIDIA